MPASKSMCKNVHRSSALLLFGIAGASRYRRFHIDRSLILQPLPFKRPSTGLELFGCQWFDQIRVRAERVAAVYIAGFVGGCEDDDNQRWVLFVAADPGELLVAKYQRQFEIDKNGR